MSIRTATLNGVATIEIARPEKKNALTVAMYEAMAEAIEALGRRRGARGADHRPAGHLHRGQRHRGLHERAPARAATRWTRRCSASCARCWTCDKPVVAAVTGAAIGIGTTMLLHCDLVYVSRRGAAGDAVRQPGPGARVRVQPARAAADGPRAARPRSCCSATRSRAEQAVECGIANARAAGRRGASTHARRVAERFNALPPGAVRESQAADARPQREAVADRRSRTEGELFARRLRSPEAMEAFQAFFQKRKPDFQPVLSWAGRRASAGSGPPGTLTAPRETVAAVRRCRCRPRCLHAAVRSAAGPDLLAHASGAPESRHRAADCLRGPAVR
ncbi:MAG: enoyl-CoA hydratase-related protein [Comamonadaceae bacterium]|nr:enoyl-CoA hydratase-related protein [Comamonadaceae bacterium]